MLCFTFNYCRSIYCCYSNIWFIEIDEHDGRSKYICWDCCMHVQLLSAFVQKCVRTNETLKGAAGSSHSQPSQSSDTAASVSNCAEQLPDWLSLSFDSEAASADSASPAASENCTAKSKKEQLKFSAHKEKPYKKKKISSDNKENRSPGLLSRKVGRLSRSDAPGHYNLRNQRAPQHATAPRAPRPKKISRRARTRQGPSRRDGSPQPLLIFSRNAARAGDEADGRSDKSVSECNFALDAGDSPAPGRGGGAALGGRKWCDGSVPRSPREPRGADADLKSLLDEQPQTRARAGEHSSNARTTPSSEHFPGGVNFLGVQSEYPRDEDLSAQFARRHLSFVC
ncbi:uncharacterized protein LOC134535204 isoform X2 [Bacillus rossius redtenbacheri]|uniref:uncharacterized protein LOC134535204 isoform X2 n=1 Tax=Bacillus rossius redtenbacheri TaxID=93214 RepID=UPI002FDED15C